MDQNQDIVAGLDIGTTKIACIVGRRNDQGKIEILGMGKARSEGVTRGVVANIPKTVESIKAAVREAEDLAGVEIGTVNVVLDGTPPDTIVRSNGNSPPSVARHWPPVSGVLAMFGNGPLFQSRLPTSVGTDIVLIASAIFCLSTPPAATTAAAAVSKRDSEKPRVTFHCLPVSLVYWSAKA